ncbi:MAG: beta-lactamase family protein [Bacteroidales bacterium]|nr:beta-lactamase family protein [Bacteroidales bacterium]
MKQVYQGILVFIVLIIILLLPSCHVGRYVWWNLADIDDYKKFPNVEINNGEEVFEFYYPSQNVTFQIPEKYNKDSKMKDFDSFLEKKKTVAFLIVRNDSLIYENYFKGLADSTIIQSFSTSKAIVSALVGIAIDEGYIYSTSQSITFFLKELENKPGFDKITIEDLLNMRSGFRFGEGYENPFGDIAKYYYGKNLEKYITNLKIVEEPDKQYNYMGVNTLLLSLIVERATNTRLNKYTEAKLWKPLGMEYDASWSVDSKKNQTIKSFCCLNARVRDFAKFGRLYLNNGNWNGEQIVPEKWVKKSTSIINDSRDSQGYPYTYQWRVLENGSFFAKGILGQYIFVYPEKNLIFVRIGKKYGGVDWADLFLELSKQL